jgi:hypothetical protein
MHWNSQPNLTFFEGQMTEVNDKLSKMSQNYAALTQEYKNYVNQLEAPDWKKKSLLGLVYQQSQIKKDEIYKTVSQFKDNYLYNGIIQLVVNDAIASDPSSSNVLSIESDNVQFNKELKDLQERVDIDGIVTSIIEDALSLGEYFIRVELEGEKGVKALHDDIDQRLYSAVYDGTVPAYFLEKKRRAGVIQIPAAETIHFCYGYSKLRMKMEQDDKTLPEYLRIGKPFMWGSFNLLNYLDILTALVPAMYVQKMNSTSIIGVSVPNETSPDDGLLAAQRYETILNRFTELNDGSQVTAQRLNAVGRFKVLPVWGDKGEIKKMDPRWDDMTDTAVMEDLRRSIMASVGVPYNFLFSGGGDKVETLKQFARYVRKLGQVREMVKSALVQLSLIHLISKGLQPKISDIKVNFVRALIDVESLETIEFVDSSVSVVKNVVDSIMGISQSTGAQLDNDVLAEFLKNNLNVIGLGTLFTFPKGNQVPTPLPGNEPQVQELYKRITKMSALLEEMKRSYDETGSSNK